MHSSGNFQFRDCRQLSSMEMIVGLKTKVGSLSELTLSEITKVQRYKTVLKALVA